MENEVFEDFINGSDSLFHYTKLTTALEYILNNSQIKLSSLNNTNDPQENKFLLLNSSAVGDVLSSLEKEIRAAQTEIDYNIRVRSRICCFCENTKEYMERSIYAYAKSRMWSQYSENHKGICLVFSKERIASLLDQIMKDSSYAYMDSVVYRNKQRVGWKTGTINGNELKRMGVKNYSHLHVITNRQELFFSKNYDYKDECEYRLCVLSESDIIDYLPIDNILMGIIVGDKCPEVYFPIIIKYGEKYNCNVRQLYWSKWEPHLLLLEKNVNNMTEKR